MNGYYYGFIYVLGYMYVINVFDIEIILFVSEKLNFFLIFVYW